MKKNPNKQLYFSQIDFDPEAAIMQQQKYLCPVETSANDYNFQQAAS